MRAMGEASLPPMHCGIGDASLSADASGIAVPAR
jgi:hypothetical protein